MSEVFKPDHGISPAQLREKVEALEKRCDVLDAQLSAALVSISALNQGLLRIEELESNMERFSVLWKPHPLTEDKP